MKTILHLVRNDLRRLRFWCLGGAALMLLVNLFGFWLLYADIPVGMSDAIIPSGEPYLTWMRAPKIRNDLGLIEIFYALGLVLLLVQADRPAGGRSFWLTRPISPWRLLAAKTIGAAIILVGIPTLVTIPWWWWCGFGARAMAYGCLSFGTDALSIGLAAAAIAVFADSLSRAILWSFLVLPGVLVAACLLLMAYSGSAPMPTSLQQGWSVVVAVLLACTVAAYYVYRHPLRPAVILSAIVLGTVTLLFCVSPRTFWWGERDEFSEHHPARAATVRLVHTRSAGQSVRGDRIQEEEVILRSELSGVPAGLKVALMTSTHQWDWDHGSMSRSRMSASRFPDGWMATSLGFRDPAHDDPETLAFYRQMEAQRRAKWAQKERPEPVHRWWWDGDENRLDVTLGIPLSKAVRLAKEPSVYEGSYSLRLVRPTLLLESPLADGSWRASQGVGLRWQERDATRKGRVLEIIETQPDDSVSRSDDIKRTPTWDPCYLVLRRDKNEFSYVSYTRPWRLGNREPTEVVVNSVRITQARLELPMSEWVRDGQRVPVDRRWFEGATLARVGLVEEARFTRTVKVEGFMLESIELPPERK